MFTSSLHVHISNSQRHLTVNRLHQWKNIHRNLAAETLNRVERMTSVLSFSPAGSTGPHKAFDFIYLSLHRGAAPPSDLGFELTLPFPSERVSFHPSLG